VKVDWVQKVPLHNHKIGKLELSADKVFFLFQQSGKSFLCSSAISLALEV